MAIKENHYQVGLVSRLTGDSMKEEMKPIIIISVVVGILLVSFLSAYILNRDETDLTDPFEGNTIDRTMSFPDDEGRHDEPYERWTFGAELTSFGTGDSYSFFASYNHLDKKDTSFLTWPLTWMVYSLSRAFMYYFYF